MWLPVAPALVLAAASGALGLVLRPVRGRPALLGAVARETSLILVLYALWRWLGGLHSSRLSDGMANGRLLHQVEQALHIANESSLEHWFLQHPLLIQAANVFYAVAHVPALIGFLVWLFLRHRDRYPRLRNTVALLTGVSLVAHLVAVAPPRFYPGLGFVDAARVYGQSVYGAVGQGVSDQVSAMPSVHVGWALIVAVGVITASTSPLALAHRAPPGRHRARRRRDRQPLVARRGRRPRRCSPR